MITVAIAILVKIAMISAGSHMFTKYQEVGTSDKESKGVSSTKRSAL